MTAPVAAPASDATFRYLGGLLRDHTGQDLLANRYWRVETVLKPLLRRHDIRDLQALHALLARGNNAALEKETVEAMLNNETSFFRDQASFSLLTGPALARLRDANAASKRLRIWSAACSTGQEAYSLAMALREDRDKWRGWTIDIVASDISSAVVARGRAARYNQFEIQRGMPIAVMLRYFDKDGDDWVARDEIASMVRFRQHNLLQSPRMLGRFDVVLCRNMIMYLNLEERGAVFENLADALNPGGFLMLGAAETVIGQTERFSASREYRGLYENAQPQSRRSAA